MSENNKETIRYYTLEEIGNQDPSLCWIIIKNSVYDVTSYLNKHPGGPELLLEKCGKDATKAFSDAGHSYDAKELKEKFKIGELMQSDRKPENDVKISMKNNKSAESKPSDRKRWIITFIGLTILIAVICFCCYLFL